MPASQKNSVSALVIERQRLRDSFNSREVDDERIDLPEFNRIIAVEAKLTRANFKSVADQRLAHSILMEDKPSRWDDFQEILFLRMQQFA